MKGTSKNRIALLATISFVTTGLLLTPTASLAMEAQGNTTPTQYFLTISQIEAHKVGDSDSTYVPLATGTGSYDIAAVNPGQQVGTLKATGTLPPGTYDKLRFTVSKSMSVKAVQNLSNGRCRTTSTPTTYTNVTLPGGATLDGSIYSGAIDNNAPEVETITVPSGSGVPDNPDFTDLGSQFRGVMPIASFTVTAAEPNIKFSFDVTNAITMVVNPLDSTGCLVFPGPPIVTVSVS